MQCWEAPGTGLKLLTYISVVLPPCGNFKYYCIASHKAQRTDCLHEIVFHPLEMTDNVKTKKNLSLIISRTIIVFVFLVTCCKIPS